MLISSDSGTSATTRDRAPPIDSVPLIIPRRVEMSAMTAPTCSSGTRTVNATIGSSRVTDAFAAASFAMTLVPVWHAGGKRRRRRPARNAEDVTGCTEPWVRGNGTSKPTVVAARGH